MTADEQLNTVLAGMDLLDPDGVGKGARPDRCPHCRAHILTGLDAERCALVARVDPHDIDTLGEYLAIRIGAPTYNLHETYSPKGRKRWELNHRTLAHIESPRRTPVLVAHRCGITIPAAKQPFPVRRLRPAPPGGTEPSF